MKRNESVASLLNVSSGLSEEVELQAATSTWSLFLVFYGMEQPVRRRGCLTSRLKKALSALQFPRIPLVPALGLCPVLGRVPEELAGAEPLVARCELRLLRMVGLALPGVDCVFDCSGLLGWTGHRGGEVAGVRKGVAGVVACSEPRDAGVLQIREFLH